MRDPHTRDPRGFAFVTMEEAEDAEACIANLSATELMGKVITVDKVSLSLLIVQEIRCL